MFLNAGFEAVDRAARDGRGAAPALRWHGPDGAEERFSFGELMGRAGKFAGLLRTLGVQRRDVVLAMTSPIPEAIDVLLGTLRYGAIFGALAPGLSEESLNASLRRTGARVLVTESEFKSSVDRVRKDHRELWHVVTVERFGKAGRMGAGDFIYSDYFDPAAEQFDAIAFRGVERALIEPGTGTVWAHHVAVTAHRAAREFLRLGPAGTVASGLAPADLFWPVLGVLAPLCAGAEVWMAHEAGRWDPRGASARIGFDGEPVWAPDGWAVPVTRAGRPLSGLEVDRAGDGARVGPPLYGRPIEVRTEERPKR